MNNILVLLGIVKIVKASTEYINRFWIPESPKAVILKMKKSTSVHLEYTFYKLFPPVSLLSMKKRTHRKYLDALISGETGNGIVCAFLLLQSY
jgi:hypothetical protein